MPFLIKPVLSPGTLARVPQPVIPTGDGLLLRPWRAEDAPALHEIFQDPLIHRWHTRAAHSEEEAGGWIDEWVAAWTEERTAQWAVADAATDRLMGRVGLNGIALDDGVTEVAYWTAPAARGQGVAARATTALARWALDETGFHRLELTHAVANTASCRVATKTGFALEGTKRSAGLHTDGWHDMHLHARVRGD
ncbi:GNAT family N-acetyltransferase [Streptomyces sp. NPDC059866]|uniref:GNAT family N-acetyltransferase n=1 Tax=Streptomyces sp. NPDC059866 TaxID=3346978 RepID=UPI003654D80E